MLMNPMSRDSFVSSPVVKQLGTTFLVNTPETYIIDIFHTLP